MNIHEELASILDGLGIRYAVIGAQAVNAWQEPRLTVDIDLTVIADAALLARLKERMAEAGYATTREQGGASPSGPDFIRFERPGQDTYVDVQTAKTEFQEVLVARAVRNASSANIAVATPEDLIVLKLLASRPKDQADLAGLATLPNLDWDHVRHWCAIWGVEDRLAALLKAPP